MTFGFISRALVGATTIGLLVVSGAGSALADEGNSSQAGNVQAGRLVNASTFRAVGGSVTAIRTDSAITLNIRARHLQPGAFTTVVIVYNHPDQCSGKFVLEQYEVGRCGGGPCMSNGVDACNSATGFKVFPLPGCVADARGSANCTLTFSPKNPQGAELEIYTGHLAAANADGSHSKAIVFFAAPKHEDRDGHGDQD